MADFINTTSTLSAIVPQVWSQNYYDVLLAELPFNSIIDRSWEGEIRSLGDRVKITSFAEFGDAVLIGEEVANDADSIGVTQQELVINSRVGKDFILTGTVQIQSLPAMTQLRKLAEYAIMKKMQSLIVAAIVPSASAPDHQIAYDSGTTLGLADILEAKELLDAQDVPLSDRHMVLGAAQWNDLFNITGFTSSDFLLTGAPLQTGQVPTQLLGFTPHFTTTAGNVSYFFHKSFMTMAAQQGLNIREYDLGPTGLRATRVNIDTLFGIKQLDNTRVVTIS